MTLLVTAEELHQLINSGDPSLRILDVRWSLEQPDGRSDYLEGHIPGAVYVDLDHELAEHGRPAVEGRHPLPTVETLQSAARRWGLREGDAVVVYDGAHNVAAARAWWLLRNAGLTEVRVLDGALPGWIAAGYSLDQGKEAPEPGDITLSEGHMDVIDIDQAGALPARGLLIDARVPERYRGEHEPVDPRAGHIPGALNVPVGSTAAPGGRFLPPEQLREQFHQLGVRPGVPVASYCGSGVAATHSVLALELAGFRAALYPGSFSQWSQHPDRPVATGGDPR